MNPWLLGATIMVAGLGQAHAVCPAPAADASRIVSAGGSVTEIIYAPGIDYHRCATWCAVGEIPFLIAANDGNT